MGAQGTGGAIGATGYLIRGVVDFVFGKGKEVRPREYTDPYSQEVRPVNREDGRRNLCISA